MLLNLDLTNRGGDTINKIFWDIVYVRWEYYMKSLNVGLTITVGALAMFCIGVLGLLADTHMT